ncbi:Complement factor H [Varanus komodoensis]|nr:Complement factor H [Varanus komodoensis]
MYMVAEKNCGPPPRMEIEELAETQVKQFYSHNDVVQYNCRPGYIKLGRIKYQCNNGEWKKTFPPVECRKKPCGHPGDAQFGTFELTVGEDFSYGSRVEYRCDDGYQMLSHTNYRICQVDGWSNDVPHCEVRKCFPVKAPVNGRMVMTGIDDPNQEFLFGQVVRFECNEDLKIEGPDQIFCTDKGEWSGVVPKCVG